jgi:hypothetical protein
MTRDERRAAVTTWRSLPLAVRRQVVTAARQGDPPEYGTAQAAETGRRYAVAVLTPAGPHWWQRHRWDARWTPVLGGIAALLVVAAFSVHATGVPWSQLWGALLLALVLVCLAELNRSLRRTLLSLAALSAGRPPSG